MVSCLTKNTRVTLFKNENRIKGKITIISHTFANLLPIKDGPFRLQYFLIFTVNGVVGVPDSICAHQEPMLMVFPSRYFYNLDLTFKYDIVKAFLRWKVSTRQMILH